MDLNGILRRVLQDESFTHGTLEIAEYTIHLRTVHLPMGLDVDDVRLTGKSIEVQSDPVRVTVAEEGQMRVHVGDHSLAAFLEHQSPAGLRKFHITSTEGELQVRAVKKVLVELKVNAVCTLRVDDRRRVSVVLGSVDVAGADIRNLIQTQLDRLNPVIDVSMFPFNAAIDHAEVDKGGITLTGRILP